MGRIRKNLGNLENLVEIMVQTKKVGGYLNIELVDGLMARCKKRSGHLYLVASWDTIPL